MARTTATNFTGVLQFPYATAGTDLFKKEDVQTLAQAVDQHDHSSGKGLVVSAASIPAGAIDGSKITDNTITSAKIQDLTIATADIANSAITSAKILDGTIVGGDIAPATLTADKLSLTFSVQTMGGDVILNPQATWVTLVSYAAAAGTWLILATVEFLSAGGACIAAAQVSGATGGFVTGADVQVEGNSIYRSVTIMTVVTSGADTWRLQGQASVANVYAKGAGATPGLSTSTRLAMVRIG
jgi:hypothetical protein